MSFLEKQILDHLGYFIKTTQHVPSEQEQKCIATYDRAPVYYGLANFLIWGSMAYYTLDFRAFFTNKSQQPQPTPSASSPSSSPSSASTSRARQQSHFAPKMSTLPRSKPLMPAWITLWGIAAITGGAFAGTYYTSKWAARDCLQCFIDVDDKKSKLYQATRDLLKEHNPDARRYFDAEKQPTVAT
ncbi:hypothetical protein HKX48_006194 [Thoreauomyces humboldtii]|nr:hypothetical protein HKX48_006194 [Thoreauomyces humboldtii]